MRILVSGDSRLVRQGLGMLLSSVDGWDVSHAADIGGARARLAFRAADVLVLDLDPYPRGLARLRELAEEDAATPIVAVMTTPSAARARAVLAAGAAGCVGKQAVAERLLPAVLAAVDERSSISA